MIGFVTVDYDTKKCDFLSRIEDALSKQLMRKPRRLPHGRGACGGVWRRPVQG